MDAMLIQKYERDAGTVPEACRFNHRAMWCDFRLRIYATPADRPLLLALIDVYTDGLRNKASASLPPPLWWAPGEDGTEYLDRCYQSAEGRFTARDLRREEFAAPAKRTSGKAE